MCFIISIVMLVLSFNFFNAGDTLLAVGSFVVSMFFIYLMIKNILDVKKLKESKKDVD
ncbi:MAG: hypothetical protein U9P72_11130 [Campylobacterota bacterium]|nr:hypothetical protein [Campylobacterota bacterium]